MNIKSVGLTKKYRNYRKKRILHYRDDLDFPLEWSIIANLFGITPGSVIYIYNKAKDERKEKKEQT